MSRILVAVSTPYAAERLAESVADMAERLRAEVLAVNVSRPTGPQGREQADNEGEASVRMLAEAIRGRGQTVQTLLLFSDDIARAILNTAKERDCTLIVLGLTGKNIFARLLAGNVPVELIKETHIPVMLLPPEWTGRV
ncbi:MAG: universal stress protein [Phycisphaerae bacterium]